MKIKQETSTVIGRQSPTLSNNLLRIPIKDYILKIPAARKRPAFYTNEVSPIRTIIKKQHKKSTSIKNCPSIKFNANEVYMGITVDTKFDDELPKLKENPVILKENTSKYIKKSFINPLFNTVDNTHISQITPSSPQKEKITEKPSEFSKISSEWLKKIRQSLTLETNNKIIAKSNKIEEKASVKLPSIKLKFVNIKRNISKYNIVKHYNP